MARDIAEVAGSHIHGIELHAYAVRIHLEPDPRYGARILRADVDGVVHFDTRSDAMGDGWRCNVGRDRLNLDGDDVREPAPPGGVLSEPDDVERATRWNDDHRVLVLDRVRQRRTDDARVFGGVAGAVGGAADDLDQTARARVGREGDGARDGVALDLSVEDGVDDGNEPAARSEERRVGKECR